MSKAATRNGTKLVVLGFDGLDPKTMESLMAQGKLPNFSRLRDEGCFHRLATTNPSQSPVAWAGFATGRNPSKTGIFDFVVRDPGTYRLRLSLSNFVDDKPTRVIRGNCFWDYTSQRKIPTVVITCPLTFPPDAVHGRMLSGMGVPDILRTEGTFSYYTSQREEKRKDAGGKVFDIKKSPVMVMHLVGPRTTGKDGKTDFLKVPFKVVHPPGSSRVTIEFQKNKFELECNSWSGWKEVSFKLGLMKKAKGIVNFYLVETDPEFKLYASPINFDPRNPQFDISYPRGYSRELAARIGLFYTQGMPMDTWAVNEKRLLEDPFIEQMNEVLREKRAMLDYELGRLTGGVLFCYFESSDIVQHMFWRYIDPQHPLHEPDAPAEYKEMIENWYRKVDDVLATTREKLDGNDTLIVLSDHGFGTFRRTVHLNSWLRKHGYLELKDSQADTGADLLSDIDWTATKAYAIGFGAIYINLEGREGYGIVPPGDEADALKSEIADRIVQWIDDKYNQPVISRVYKQKEIFGSQSSDEIPDLFVGFNIGYRASRQTALGGVPDTLIEDNLKKWSGSHLFDPSLVPGVLFSNRPIRIENPSIYDITPTILKIVGYSADEIRSLDMDGTPLFD
ncbi:MAG: alkaline phosphatase family protein [bacterium]|nr:MAG: alkaline phosphatase family protein [bacterium]